jgi:hypothetical protein
LFTAAELFSSGNALGNAVPGQLRPSYDWQREQAMEPQMKWLFIFPALIATSWVVMASQSALAFEFAQGVIVNGIGSVVYVMNPEGGIDAVNLSGGAVLATTTRGAKPVSELGEKLEQAVRIALNEVVAILGFSLDPDDRAFATILKAKTTILNSVLNAQVRIDETRFETGKKDRLEGILAAAERSLSHLERAYGR